MPDEVGGTTHLQRVHHDRHAGSIVAVVVDSKVRHVMILVIILQTHTAVPRASLLTARSNVVVVVVSELGLEAMVGLGQGSSETSDFLLRCRDGDCQVFVSLRESVVKVF